jgi:hypothetical protein
VQKPKQAIHMHRERGHVEAGVTSKPQGPAPGSAGYAGGTTCAQTNLNRQSTCTGKGVAPKSKGPHLEALVTLVEPFTLFRGEEGRLLWAFRQHGVYVKAQGNGGQPLHHKQPLPAWPPNPIRKTKPYL